MSFIDGFRHRLRVWTRGAEYERHLDEEMRFHLSLDAAHNGAQDGDRRHDGAHRRFGNVTYLKEETRRVAGLDHLDGIGQDARHLMRSLRRSPGFAIVATLTLALGIGTTTAVLSVVDHVLVNALPFRDPSKLMMMLERGERGGFRAPSYPTAEDWRRDPAVQQAFEGITFIRGDGVAVTSGGTTERVGAAFVSEEFFPLLGARPAVGRLLTDDDHRPGAPPAVVIAYGLWQHRFGGDPSIVGRTMSVDSLPTTIVGVLPRGAVYPGFASIWQPVSQYRHPEILARRGVHSDSRTLARLRPGIDSARAVALMRTVDARLAAAYPAEQAHWSAAMFPVEQEIIGDVQPMLLALAAAAAAVLLLACANVANLLLARVAARTREIAVRSALGASRARIVRQLLTESALLSTIGGLFGTGLAVLAVRLARRLPPDQLPRVEELAIDHRVLFIAAGASLLTAMLCGLWPAIRATRPASGEVLRASALGSMGQRSESRLRRVLVTVQFALALVLLVGAGLLLQSFRRAAAVDVGFDPTGLVKVRVNLPSGAYEKPGEAAALYRRLIEATRAVPGVVDAAVINHFPFAGASVTTPVEAEGHSTIDTASNQVFYRSVSASYLSTMRMSLFAGRWFTPDDERSPAGQFVINQAMARQYWPNQSAIGKRVTVRRSSQGRADFGQPLPGVVIGVIADVHQTSQEAVPEPEIYVPYTLETWPWTSLVMRTRDGARSIPALRRAVMGVEPRIVPDGADGAVAFETVDTLIASRLEPRKLSMRLISAFATCALVLAAIGMYGVTSYGVAQRTRELGVRKALGATDQMIARLVLRESLVLAALGVVLGCAGAWASARSIRALLFNTGVADPVAYGLTIVLLTSVALIASYLPARRATRLDPTIAMRGE